MRVRPNQAARQKRNGIMTKSRVSARTMKVQRLLRSGRRIVVDVGELLTSDGFLESNRIAECALVGLKAHVLWRVARLVHAATL